MIIGISSGDTPAVEQVGPVEALTLGVVYTGRLTLLTLESLYKLVAREVPLKSIGGPILIAQMAGKQAEMGLTYLVQFMAALSINLFLINLLPSRYWMAGTCFSLPWRPSGASRCPCSTGKWPRDWA